MKAVRWASADPLEVCDLALGDSWLVEFNYRPKFEPWQMQAETFPAHHLHCSQEQSSQSTFPHFLFCCHHLEKLLLSALMLRDKVGFGEESLFLLWAFQRLYCCNSVLDERHWEVVRQLETLT